MKAIITDFPTDSNWVEGKIEKYDFQAKLFDEGSEYGIDGGRVSELAIYDETVRQEKKDFLGSCIVHYDRGWDVKPKEGFLATFRAVMEVLENAPKRFED